MRHALIALACLSAACSSNPPARDVANATSAKPAGPQASARFEDCVEIVDVQRALAARNMAFQDCYSDGLARDPNLSGTVTLNVVIPPSGEGRVEVASSTLASTTVAECIVEVAAGLEFEQDSCSVAQTVEYPVRLARGSSEFAAAD
jgi:hypothetical protein